MNWSPTDLYSLKYFNNYNEEIYKELSKNLDSRKNLAIKMIIKEPTLFTYLKNNIYNKEGK